MYYENREKTYTVLLRPRRKERGSERWSQIKAFQRGPTIGVRDSVGAQHPVRNSKVRGGNLQGEKGEMIPQS